MTTGFYIASACAAVYSYLLGSVNGAVILSKLIYKRDIRNEGSKNAGFTNFKRVFGNTAWFVFVIDILKTLVPVLTTKLTFGHSFSEGIYGAALSGLFCVLGHCFPVWHEFKGGKGILAYATAIWFIDWRAGLIALGVHLLILFTVKIMALASVTAAAVFPVFVLIFSPSVPAIIICFVASAFVIVRHKDNIVRMINKEEKKFYLFGSKKV